MHNPIQDISQRTRFLLLSMRSWSPDEVKREITQAVEKSGRIFPVGEEEIKSKLPHNDAQKYAQARSDLAKSYVRLGHAKQAGEGPAKLALARVKAITELVEHFHSSLEWPNKLS